MNILITSAGQRVSLVRAFQKELKKFYTDAHVYTSDMNPQLSAACNISDRYFQVNRVTDPHYVNQLLEICVKHNIKMVIPTIDTELIVLAQHKNKFSDAGINVIVSEVPFVEKCRDKRKINLFFEKNGMEVPRPIDKHNPVFPLFIKPFDGSLSVDTYLIKSAGELMEHHLQNDRFLFMEYINKEDHDEYTVDMYYSKQYNLKCIVPRKRIFVRAGEINKGVTSKNIIVSYLKEKLSHIPGAIGCLTLQLFLNKHTSRIVAIEINPRFGGGYPLSYHAGANYPLWLINEYFNNKSIDYTDNWEDNLLMLRYDDEVIVHAN